MLSAVLKLLSSLTFTKLAGDFQFWRCQLNPLKYIRVYSILLDKMWTWDKLHKPLCYFNLPFPVSPPPCLSFLPRLCFVAWQCVQEPRTLNSFILGRRRHKQALAAAHTSTKTSRNKVSAFAEKKQNVSFCSFNLSEKEKTSKPQTVPLHL